MIHGGDTRLKPQPHLDGVAAAASATKVSTGLAHTYREKTNNSYVCIISWYDGNIK